MSKQKRLDKVIIIDLETTCEDEKIDPEFQNEIIEIGIAILNPYSFEITKEPSIFVVPPYTKITEFCTKLTGITPEQVDPLNGAIHLLAACDKLREKYHSRQCAWGSWGAFDRKQFERQTSPKVYPFGPSHINIKNLFSLMFNIDKELSLPKAIEWAQLSFEGRNHSGQDDAYNAAILMRKILE